MSDNWLRYVSTNPRFQPTQTQAEAAEYPNMPSWISRLDVYLAWMGLASIGGIGYALFRRGWETPGLVVLALYTCLGFDGLPHYTRAPFAEHTATMNLTILFEVAAAALLLLAVVRHGFEKFRLRQA